jgi:hypothetical protein
VLRPPYAAVLQTGTIENQTGKLTAAETASALSALRAHRYSHEAAVPKALHCARDIDLVCGPRQALRQFMKDPMVWICCLASEHTSLACARGARLRTTRPAINTAHPRPLYVRIGGVSLLIELPAIAFPLTTSQNNPVPFCSKC